MPTRAELRLKALLEDENKADPTKQHTIQDLIGWSDMISKEIKDKYIQTGQGHNAVRSVITDAGLRPDEVSVFESIPPQLSKYISQEEFNRDLGSTITTTDRMRAENPDYAFRKENIFINPVASIMDSNPAIGAFPMALSTLSHELQHVKDSRSDPNFTPTGQANTNQRRHFAASEVNEEVPYEGRKALQMMIYRLKQLTK